MALDTGRLSGYAFGQSDLQNCHSDARFTASLRAFEEFPEGSGHSQEGRKRSAMMRSG